MKKILLQILTLLLCLLLLAGCNRNKPTETETTGKTTEPVQTAAEVTEQKTEPAPHTTTPPETEAPQTEEPKTEAPQTEAPQTEEQTTQTGDKTTQLRYRFTTKEEGVELMTSNTEYYAGFSQNDIDFKLMKSGGTMDEYMEMAKKQVRDFTESDIAVVDGYMAKMEKTLADNGYVLPPCDEIVFIKTTMAEEGGAGGYTHGTQIYILDWLLESVANGNEYIIEYMNTFFWHELFHCLTRSNPDFRKDMYEIIHFTVKEEDFPIPPSAFEYHISNPDVEHHNSYATFIINGEPIDCFVDLITTKHFEDPSETFFEFMTTAIIPIDGTDIYYTPEQTENFYEIFGKNTGYTVDPEECLADNFSYALAYGMAGPDGNGYESPEIIEAILSYLSNPVTE